MPTACYRGSNLCVAGIMCSSWPAISGLKDLVARNLVEVVVERAYNHVTTEFKEVRKLRMHDQLRDMGRQIQRERHGEHLGRRWFRVWNAAQLEEVDAFSQRHGEVGVLASVRVVFSLLLGVFLLCGSCSLADGYVLV